MSTACACTGATAGSSARLRSRTAAPPPGHRRLERRRRATRCRLPFRRIGFTFERAARDERLREVLRVVDNRRDRDVAVPVRLVVAIEPFGHDGILAVRHAVLAQIACAHLTRDDAEAASRGWTNAAEPEAARLRLSEPLRVGDSLP